MSEQWWGEKRPGMNVFVGSEERGTANELLFSADGIPHWVHLPLELGGNKVRVTGWFNGPCPRDGAECRPIVRHLMLEGDVWVAECMIHGFLWYQKPADSAPVDTIDETA